ncbi:MAG: hydroxymethylbilane synthase [Thermoprotei archaeon]
MLRSMGHTVELVVAESHGDVDKSTPLSKLGVKGVFERKVDEMILSGEADLAVHSLKDVPTDLQEGVFLAAVPERESPYDAIVPVPLNSVPNQATVATGSLRRASVIKFLRPDVKVVGIRGNVDTRIFKIRSGKADALVVAEAALRRLGLTYGRRSRLDPKTFVPSPGQGALAVTAPERPGKDLEEVLKKLNSVKSMDETSLERKVASDTGAGCDSPIGILAKRRSERNFLLSLSIVSPSLDRRVHFTVEDSKEDLVDKAVEGFEALGGREVVKDWRQKADTFVSETI